MTSHKQGLAANTRYLAIIQLSSYLLPLLIIPILTRRLGVDAYGAVAFGLAIIQVSSILTDYGFAFYGTYELSRWRHRSEYVERLISAVYLCKGVILAPVVLTVLLYASLQVKYSGQSTYFWLLVVPIVGQALQPTWVFQGVERMGFVAVSLLLSRLLFIGLSMFLVENSEDVYYVAVANGTGQVLAALVGIFALAPIGYKLRWPEYRLVKRVFLASTPFFWSRASAAIYTSCGTIYLAAAAPPSAVAFYSAAEQVYKGVQGLVGVASQALYPYMARYRDFALLFRVTRVVAVLVIAGGTAAICGIGRIALVLVFGAPFSDASNVLSIFMLTAMIAAPSVLLGYPFLAAVNKVHLANRSVFVAGIVQGILLALCYAFGLSSAVQVATCVFVAELTVLAMRLWWLSCERVHIDEIEGRAHVGG